MKSILFLSFCSYSFLVLSQIPDAQWQIKTAVLAAPEPFRAEATILGYNQNGELVTLKEGTNDMICLADDPKKKGFSVSAYHKSLEPFMARGRELQAAGKNFKEIFDIRETESKEGKVSIPHGVTLFVLTGEIKEDNNEIINSYLRYVVYIPYATAESTGLPLNPPGPGGPWIMDPGTHRAHIMINPPKN